MEGVTLKAVTLDSGARHCCSAEVRELLEDIMVRVKNRMDAGIVPEPSSIARQGNKQLVRQKVVEGLRRTNSVIDPSDVEVIGGDLRTELVRGYKVL